MSEALFGQRARLCYFEAVLFSHGGANSSTLTALGISRQQAVTDIAEYRRLAGPKVSYDSSRRAFVAESRTKPALLSIESMPLFIISIQAVQYLANGTLKGVTKHARKPQKSPTKNSTTSLKI